MKKLKRPKKVEIGALTYKIRYVKPGKGIELKAGENGCINQTKQLIEIDKDISDQLTMLVLFHEFLHGVGDAISPTKSPFNKEEFTNTVSELLLQALQTSELLPTLSNDLPQNRRGKRKGKK